MNEITPVKERASTNVSPGGGLGRRALHGLIWMLAQNVAARICSLFSQLALAALLKPSDFGLIGLAYTVTSVASTLTSVGIDDVLLQRQRHLRYWTGTAFWISFSMALLAGLLVVLVSPLAAMAYHAPSLVGILAVIALSMPIGALSSVPGTIIRARMQFSLIATYGTVEMIVQILMTIGFAWGGYGAYSFVLPVPILAAIRTAVWWRLAGYRTSFRFQFSRWKYLVGNTAATFASRTVIQVMGQGGAAVLGLIASEGVVGVYYFGFRLAAQPLWMLAGNFSGVLFPALVQFKSDPVRQGAAALKASTLLSFAVMPLAFVQAAVAAPMIVALFGHRWVASIPIIQLLSIGLALDAVSWVAGSLLSARGEFKAGLRYLLIQMPLFFISMGVGAWLDKAVGVAMGVCLYYAVTQPVYVWRVYRRLGITAREVALIYVRPTLYAAVAAGAGLAVAGLPVFAALPIIRIGIIGAIGSVLYALLVRLLAREVWRELSDRVWGALRRRGAV